MIACFVYLSNLGVYLHNLARLIPDLGGLNETPYAYQWFSLIAPDSIGVFLRATAGPCDGHGSKNIEAPTMAGCRLAYIRKSIDWDWLLFGYVKEVFRGP